MIKEYHAPATVEEAVALKERLGDSAVFLAGGTEVNSTAFPFSPEHVISLQRLPLTDIRMTDSELVIGAGCTIQQIIDSADVPEIIKAAGRHMVNRNIRNVATIGGQLGSNRSCSNLLPLLVALDAVVDVGHPPSATRHGGQASDKLRASSGPAPLKSPRPWPGGGDGREAASGAGDSSDSTSTTPIPMYIGIGTNSGPTLPSVVDPAGPGATLTIPALQYIEEQRKELITHVRVRTSAPARRFAVERYSRTANDLSLLTAAVSLARDGEAVVSPIIAAGGLAKHVIRLEAVEKALCGQPLPRRDAVERLVASHVSPITDIRGTAEFKRHLAGGLVAKALLQAYRQAGGQRP